MDCVYCNDPDYNLPCPVHNDLNQDHLPQDPPTGMYAPLGAPEFCSKCYDNGFMWDGTLCDCEAGREVSRLAKEAQEKAKEGDE